MTTWLLLPLVLPSCPAPGPLKAKEGPHVRLASAPCGREDGIFELNTLSGRDCLEESKFQREGTRLEVMAVVKMQSYLSPRWCLWSFPGTGLWRSRLGEGVGNGGRRMYWRVPLPTTVKPQVCVTSPSTRSISIVAGKHLASASSPPTWNQSGCP